MVSSSSSSSSERVKDDFFAGGGWWWWRLVGWQVGEARPVGWSAGLVKRGRAGTMGDFFLGIELGLDECHTLLGEGTLGGTCTNEMRAKCADGSFLFRCQRVG